jgi:hypothetical protein
VKTRTRLSVETNSALAATFAFALAATTFAELAARAKIKHAPQPGKAKQHDFQARARRNKKWRCDLRVNEYMT